MKKFISIAVALCMVLSLAMVPVSAETVVLTDNFEAGENQGTITNGSKSGGHYASSNGLLVNSSDTYGPGFSFAEGYNSSVGLSVPYGVLYEAAGYRGGTVITKKVPVGSATYKLSYKICFEKIATTPAKTVYANLSGFSASGIDEKVSPFWVSTDGVLTVSGSSTIKSPAYTLSSGKWYTMESVVDLDGSLHAVLKDDSGAVVSEALFDRSAKPLAGEYAFYLLSHVSKTASDAANTIIDDVSLTTYDLAEAPIYDAVNSTVAAGDANVSITDPITVAFDQPIVNPEDVVIYEAADASKTPISITIENHKMNSFDIVPGAAQLRGLTEYVIDCTALTNGTATSKNLITFTTEDKAPTAPVLSDDFDTDGQVGTIINHSSGDRYQSANGVLAATPVAPDSGDGSFSFQTMTIEDDGTGTNKVLKLVYNYAPSEAFRGPALMTKAVDLSAGSYKLTYDIKIDDAPDTTGSYLALGHWSRNYKYSASDVAFYIRGGETPSVYSIGEKKVYTLAEDTWYKVEMYYTAEGIVANFLDSDGKLICSSIIERKAEDGLTYNLYVAQHIKNGCQDDGVTMIDNVSLTTYSKNISPMLVETGSLEDGSVIATVAPIVLTFDQTIANPEDIVIYADSNKDATVDFAVEESAGLKYTIIPANMAEGDYVIDLSKLTNGTSALSGTKSLTFSAKEAVFGITSAKITSEKLEIESESNMDGIKMTIVTVGYTTNAGVKKLTGTHIVRDLVAGESVSSDIHKVISSADEVKSFVFLSTKTLRPVCEPIDVIVEQAETTEPAE